MKEEEVIVKEKWHKGNLPFTGGLQKFKAVGKADRSTFIKGYLDVKQDPNSPPVLFLKDFTSSGKFKYQEYELHYHALEQTQNPKAIFIHSHGLNSHGGNAGYLASIIADKNPELNVYSFDQLNFGRSPGPYKG